MFLVVGLWYWHLPYNYDKPPGILTWDQAEPSGPSAVIAARKDGALRYNLHKLQVWIKAVV